MEAVPRFWVNTLDLCSVADGTFDGFADFSSGLALWDYAGGLLSVLSLGCYK